MDTTPDVDADVVVVGAGCAGTAAALKLAQAGLSVIVIDRGDTPGAKNLSGGVLYTHAATDLFDGFLAHAPVERVITRNVVQFLNAGSGVAIDYRDQALEGNAVSVLRARLDPWLAAQCESAGAMVMPGVRVDRLVIEDAGGQRRVLGVEAGGDTLRCHHVVAADGVNSFLSRAAGLRSAPRPNQLAVGIKSTVALDAAAIEARFGVSGHEGAAFAVVGDCTEGIGGGGFLYTNRESVSIGVVLRLDDLAASGKTSSDVHDRFLAHPLVAPYLKGGELLEYGCHLVAEGGLAMVGEIAMDGLVVVGDAAGLTLNTGLTVRGMDLAMASGAAAAEAIAAGQANGEAAGIGADYRRRLFASFVGKDMETYAKAPAFLERRRLYGAYGDLAASVLRGAFLHDRRPRRHLASVAWGALRGSGIGLSKVAGDGLAGVRAL
ncbi:MAG: FAD-dependent oxidoreductase [Bifidobacteriaceae bacterium]|jgi:electron transfer flavoprotein-quinone oxidoreductase|nr:FAD-dependent oxidoreductase [Bifidobacteriaceae bacterium]